jgi:hypothetical protein
MIVLFILAVGTYWGHPPASYWGVGMTAVQYVLFGLLGWQVFGPAVKG